MQSYAVLDRINEDGLKFVSDARLGATGFTGSRKGGLALKAAADAAGKPIYLELSSVNPVVILPGALAERGDAIADDFSTSCLMAAGQFCTNPGLVFLLAGDATDAFVSGVATRFGDAPIGTLLSGAVEKGLGEGVKALQAAGAELVTGGTTGGGTGRSHSNTLLKATGKDFLANPAGLQEEAFGNESLFVICDDIAQVQECLRQLEGNLTGCVYSDTNGADDDAYNRVAPLLAPRVGRLLNDKMPTGVAVTPAMNHGGPFPATGHPGFTAVGIPGALRRFSQLLCYDNVRAGRLPAALADKNPSGSLWRVVDGQWSQADVG